MSEHNLPKSAEQAETDIQMAPQDGDIVSAAEGKGEVKNLGVIDSDDPRAQALGGTGSRALQVDPDWIKEVFTDQIYGDNEVFFREFTQNAETACIRAARMALKNHEDYGAGWLQHTLWVDDETGETVAVDEDRQKILARYADDPGDLKKITVPRPLHEVVEAARSIGYDPTIEVDLHRDERKVVFTDNGIGMTLEEIDGAYNFLGRSGSAVDGDTGGKWGAGARTFAIMTGMEGGMIGETRTRLPDSANVKEPFDNEGHRAYIYPGGYDLLNADVDEDFYGTRFTIPIQESVNLGDFSDWAEKFGRALRVPMLYREHESGRTVVKEEYGGQSFVELFNEPPVVIDRPGEFTAVAGPNIPSKSRDPDTWLVSMEIDRNTGQKVKSFWKVALQIHDEQGRIISGPHRGEYRSQVDELHEDDIILPEPTVDRDRLQKDSHSKKFFSWLSEQVKQAEFEVVSDIATAMDELDHPGDAIRQYPDDWTVFKRMVMYHKSYSTFRTAHNFKTFIRDLEGTPDYDDETAEKIYLLFRKVSHAKRDTYSPTKKKSRDETYLGDILANCDPSHVFMAASTGGNFSDQYKVVYNTFDDAAVIVTEGARKYDEYESNFGFQLLKNVPLEQSDDHDFTVPQSVHDRHKKRQQRAKQEKSKPQTVEDRVLKFRTNNQNKQIDQRLTIERVKDTLDRGGNFGGHHNIVLFLRSGESISNHYDLQRHAAIASATNAEYEALRDYDRVFTYEEFREFSEATAIATEDGAMTPAELNEDDRLVVLLHVSAKKHRELLKDDGYHSRLRRLVSEYARDEIYWNDPSEIPDTLFAVADARTLKRAEYALRKEFPNRSSIVGLRVGTSHYHGSTGLDWKNISSRDYKRLEVKAETPEWDNSSEVYKLYDDQTRDGLLQNVLLGFHDAGLDPTELEPDEARTFVKRAGMVAELLEE